MLKKLIPVCLSLCVFSSVTLAQTPQFSRLQYSYLFVGDMARISYKTGTEAQTDKGSVYSSMSRDGRFVVFASAATNLHSSAPAAPQIYLHDRTLRTTTLISKNDSGQVANDGCFSPVISADGTRIAYSSKATNLVPADTNNMTDVFLYQVASRTTLRISLAVDGYEGRMPWRQATLSDYITQVHMSPNGMYVVFETSLILSPAYDQNGKKDIYRVDFTGQPATLVSGIGKMAGNKESRNPRVSDNGVVVFETESSNLDPSDTNGLSDIYIYDPDVGYTQRLTSSLQPTHNPSISSDGNLIAYTVTVGTSAMGSIEYIDRTTGDINEIDDEDPWSGYPIQRLGMASVSDDGNYIVYNKTSSMDPPTSSNAVMDVYVHSVPTGENRHVSLNQRGSSTPGFFSMASGNAMSANNEFITFFSTATDLLPSDSNGNVADIYVTGNPFHMPEEKADLRVLSTYSQRRVTTTTTDFVYMVSMENIKGGSSVQSGSLVIRFPTDVISARLENQAPCTLSAGVFRCYVGNLKSGEILATRAHVVMKNPKKFYPPNRPKISLSVSSEVRDPNSINNVVAVP